MSENEDNFRQFGCYHTALGRVLKNRHTAALEDSSMDHPAAGIEPIHHVIEGARAYAQAKGLGDPHSGINYHNVTTNRGLLTDLAHHYDKLPLNDPAAHKHFAAMRDETAQQFHFMTHNMGMKVHVTDEDPYKDVHELRHDVLHNHQIKVLGTHATGGHPFLSNHENDQFRAVHDVFGHLGTGRDFDRHGEEAAYQAHSRMYSHHARPALASETRGQNGSLITNGHFGPQRIAVLPHHLWNPGLASSSSRHGSNELLERESSVERVAILLGNADGSLEPAMRVVAHVSGNAINVLHCPFCGSGAVIARSDGTIECGYCTSVFTVQVQPAYNGFPQSVDGQDYAWPGQPAPEDTLAPTPPPGTNLAPGTVPPGGDPMADPSMGMDGPPESSDPGEGGDPDAEGDEDSDDDKPAFLKGKGDKKDDKSKDKGKKGKNPFAKGSSYRTVNGAELPVAEFLAHLAISTSHNQFATAQKVRRARLNGEL